MAGLFSNMKKRLMGEDDVEEDSGVEEEYVELDTGAGEDQKSKVVVRPFTIQDFSDIKEILDVLRDGSTIALVNIKPLMDKDLVELKRAINKLKKTCEAVEGDIAGLGDDYIVITPSFAEIYRSKDVNAVGE